MNSIRAYSGIEPYCFISYAHLDIEIISERLNMFNQEGIRFWYDEGIISGE